MGAEPRCITCGPHGNEFELCPVHGVPDMQERTDIEEETITLNRTQLVAPGVWQGWSDQYPDRQFLIVTQEAGLAMSPRRP